MESRGSEDHWPLRPADLSVSFAKLRMPSNAAATLKSAFDVGPYLGSLASRIVAATVKAIAAGSQQSTIKSISHRTAASGVAPAIIARYRIGPVDASMRKRSPASAARCACKPSSAAVAACRCASSPSRVTRCCVAMLMARVTRPRRVDSSTARSICATRPSRSATVADCAVTRASSVQCARRHWNAPRPPR